jgi:hypothetical protein
MTTWFKKRSFKNLKRPFLSSARIFFQKEANSLKKFRIKAAKQASYTFPGKLLLKKFGIKGRTPILWSLPLLKLTPSLSPLLRQK